MPFFEAFIFHFHLPLASERLFTAQGVCSDTCGSDSNHLLE